MIKSTSIYYPRNGIIIFSIFFIWLFVGFLFIEYDNSEFKQIKMQDILFSLLSASLMVILPAIALIRKVKITDNYKFELNILFRNKRYNQDDLQEILIQNRFGTKKYLAIIMKDGRKMGISTNFWSMSFYNKIKEYFEKNNQSKINNTLEINKNG